MARLGTRALVVTVGATDFTAQVSKVVISSAESDSDFETFADAAAGGSRKYTLDFTAEQNMVAASLWDLIWTGAGTSVAYLVKPYGNAAASATQPHYSGNAIVSEPDGDFIGGEANSSTTAAMTVECSWELTAKPTKVVA